MRGLAGCLLAGAFLLVCAASAAGAAEGRWPGVDEAVVERHAREHGRAAKPGLIDLEGDAQLFAFLAAGAAGGFVMGYLYRGHFSRRSEGAGRK